MVLIEILTHRFVRNSNIPIPNERNCSINMSNTRIICKCLPCIEWIVTLLNAISQWWRLCSKDYMHDDLECFFFMNLIVPLTSKGLFEPSKGIEGIYDHTNETIVHIQQLIIDCKHENNITYLSVLPNHCGKIQR